jgi:hypothetical protein
LRGIFSISLSKTSVISPEFRQRYLGDGDSFECKAVVFDGSTDYHDRINDPALGIDEHTILVIRGSGPLGWPGSAEVVNMQPPDALLKRGIMSLPTLGDGRQSGTSDSPSILNCSPESAAGGGLAWLRTGDRIRIDLAAGRCDMLVSDEEIARRKTEGLPPVPESATPWQELYRSTVGQLDSGAVMELALCRSVARRRRATITRKRGLMVRRASGSEPAFRSSGTSFRSRRHSLRHRAHRPEFHRTRRITLTRCCTRQTLGDLPLSLKSMGLRDDSAATEPGTGGLGRAARVSTIRGCWLARRTPTGSPRARCRVSLRSGKGYCLDSARCHLRTLRDLAERKPRAPWRWLVKGCVARAGCAAVRSAELRPAGRHVLHRALAAFAPHRQRSRSDG